MRNFNRAIELARLEGDTRSLGNLIATILAKYSSSEAVRMPFHSAYRADVGQELSEEQAAIKVWRDRLGERNDRLRSYLIFYNRNELSQLLPLIGFGSVINFGYSITGEASKELLAKELETIHRESQEQSTFSQSLMTPWGPIIAVFRDLNDADFLLAVAEASGLIAPQLEGGSNYSHKTRVRSVLAWLGKVYEECDDETKRRLSINISRELLRRRPGAEEQLRESLAAIGWQLIDGDLIPIEVLSPEDFASLPIDSHADLLKAAKRFSYDPSGAVSAACGAVDSVTASTYAICSLGKPGDDSFQQRVNRSLKAMNVIEDMQSDLVQLGWEEHKAREFAATLKGGLSQTAKVMETLRSHMGDAHGTKLASDAMVLNSIRWASTLCSFLTKSK